jgi:hypothetical protein
VDINVFIISRLQFHTLKTLTMADTRAYLFTYFEDTKQWGFIANNSINNVTEKSFIPLQEWRINSENESEIKSYTLFRVIYTKNLAQSEINKAATPMDIASKLMMGPDLYVICQSDTKSRVATIWHPGHLKDCIDITLSDRNVLLDGKASLENIRNAFGTLMNCKIELSHETASRAWHVLGNQ